MYGHTVSLSFEQRRKVWRFPADRFVDWGLEDESYCRLAGYGHEEEITETIRIPRAVITDLRPDGFTAMALPDEVQAPTLPVNSH